MTAALPLPSPCGYTSPFSRTVHPRTRTMTRIAILGATGYTALELIKILLRHPEAEIVAVTSRQEGQPPIAMIHPSLTGRLDLRLEDLEPGRGGRPGRVRLQLPAARGQRRGDPARCWPPAARVVDFSADYRLDDPEVFAQWYGQKHADPGPAGQGRLRPARAVPRADRAGARWWPIRAATPPRPSWRWRRC